jgi:thioredoxin-like negative regulator of GroEL
MNHQLQTELQQAMQAFQDGDFSKVELILNKVFLNDINGADRIYGIAINYAKNGRLKEASEIFECLNLSKMRSKSHITWDAFIQCKAIMKVHIEIFMKHL